MRTYALVVLVTIVVTVVGCVTDTMVVNVETRVVGATVAVAVDTVVEVPVATREQILEIRDSGHREMIEGVGKACRGWSMDKVWIALLVTYAVESLTAVDLSVLMERTVEAAGVAVVTVVVMGAT